MVGCVVGTGLGGDTVKIIETKTAPNPRRVRVFLAEKGIEMTFEPFEFTTENLRSAAFTAMNPMQKVPILVLDDGSCISETVAICRYFEETNPEPALMGSDAKSKAVVEMWNRRIELGLFFHIAQAFRHLHPSMVEREVPQVAEWGESNKPKAQEQLRILDGQLGKTQFVAGDAFSIADITAMVAIDFMKPARIERPDGLVNVERWYGEVSARPSASA